MIIFHAYTACTQNWVIYLQVTTRNKKLDRKLLSKLNQAAELEKQAVNAAQLRDKLRTAVYEAEERSVTFMTLCCRESY